jgi:hypothetical protein
MTDESAKKVEQEIIPPSAQAAAPREPGNLEPRMPLSVPFGIGFFGVAKFAGIRRAFEAMERANRAVAGYHDSQGAVADAIVRKVSAFTQLERLDTIRNDTAQRIEAAYEHTKHARAAALRAEKAAIEEEEIGSLRRQLDLLEAEENLRQRREQINKARTGETEKPEPSPSEDERTKAWFSKMAEFVKHVEGVKAKIIEDAGGEENLSEALRSVIEGLDAVVQAILSKKQEEYTA